MSNQLVGLENIPNVYIPKITLRDNTTETYSATVRLQVMDVEESKGFIWKTHSSFYNFLKVCLVSTRNVDLAKSIKDGSQSPHPLEIINSPNYNDEETKLHKIPLHQFIKSEEGPESFFDKNVKTDIGFDVADFIIFAFCYIDTRDLSKHFNIDLGGLLREYFGAITSEKIIENKKFVDVTSLFVQTNNDVWPGPIHLQPGGGYMAGSFHNETAHPSLRELKVQNIKLVDARTILYHQKAPISYKSNTIISNLHYSINSHINLIGLFSINLKQFALLKTKHGKTMFHTSPKLFQEFLSSMEINSLSVIRQQIKTLRVTNTLGTPKVGIYKTDSYKYLSTTIDESANNLRNTDNLQQIYLNEDYKIRHYQFTDDENNAKTKGQFAYKVEVTIADKSQEFMNKKINDLQNNISRLKETIYLLNKKSSYNYKTDKLRKGKEVSPIILGLIQSYYMAKSYFNVMSDFEINHEINQRVALLTTANYTSIEGERFINEFEALLTTFMNKFKIRSKYNTTTRPKNNKRSFIPNLISFNKQFEEIIQFSDYRRYYNYLDKVVDINSPVTRQDLQERASQELTKFFDPDKSSAPVEFSNLKDSVSKAITSTKDASGLFLSPLSFNFDGGDIGLTSLSNVDNAGLASQFLKSQVVAEAQIQVWKSSKRRNSKRKKNVPANPRAKKVKVAGLRGSRRIFSTSFKVPQEINKEIKIVEPLIKSNEYLGDGSYFVNPEGNLNEPSIDSHAPAVVNLMNVTSLKTGMNKFNFDLTTPKSAIGAYIRSPRFNESTLKNAPVAWKALVCSRAPAAKNEILSTPGDILQNAETKVTTEMVFQTSQKLQMLSGYKRDLNNEPILSSPIWADIDPKLLPKMGGVLCRMVYAEIPELGISPNEMFKLPYLNQTFIVADQNPTINISEVPSFSLPGSDINMTTKNKLSQNIKYATSNVVSQSRRKDPFRRWASHYQEFVTEPGFTPGGSY